MAHGSKEKSDNINEKCPDIVHGHIHWYPGHIAKAEKKLKEQLNLVDVVIEVLDARIPLSSCYGNIEKLLGEKPRLLVLNKADLVDNNELKIWVDFLQKKFNHEVLAVNTKTTKELKIIVDKVLELSEPKIQQLMNKGLLRRPSRVMVVGMPNVGKSSIINKLTRTSKTKVGAKAGVTRQQQWVRINPKIDLLDTPGIIPMKQENQERAKKLAFVNSISENAYSNEIVVNELLEILSKKYSQNIKSYYNLERDLTIENIATARNWLKAGAKPDIDKAATLVLSDFRNGKIGKFILDDIEE